MPLTTPEFVSQDALQEAEDTIAALEVALGVRLAPADVLRLVAGAFAYRITLLRSQVNYTGRQNLVSFSTGSALDYLGELLGVVRLPASATFCTIRFTLVAGHGPVTIPQGIRVQTTDGVVAFATEVDTPVDAAQNTVDVQCFCTTDGKAGNSYAPGTVSIILDPLPFISLAANIDTTAGGADDETDDELRERIKLAPGRFSVAGPYEAYRYYAKSANPAIVDVAVMGPAEGFQPGEVHLFPLLENGALPNQVILDQVNAICNDEKVRPLTDTVFIAAPTQQQTTVQVDLTLITGAIASEVVPVITKLLDDYKQVRLNKLGLDVLRSQIQAIAMLPGTHKVYNAVVNTPAADIVTVENEFVNITGVSLNVTGYHDE